MFTQFVVLMKRDIYGKESTTNGCYCSTCGHISKLCKLRNYARMFSIPDESLGYMFNLVCVNSSLHPP